jgi:hypothetical protein
MTKSNTRRPAASPEPPPPVRPWMCDRVHAALVKAGRPVTRSELWMFLVNNHARAADLQVALDALVAEGAAVLGEEGPVPGRWRAAATYRATGAEEGQR